MYPITRKEFYLAKAAGTYTGPTPAPVLREDYYLATLAGDYSGNCPAPVTRLDMFMSTAAGLTSYVPQPVTRIEKYWYAIAKGTGYVPEPVTREEKFLYALVKNKPEPPKPEYVDKTAHGNPILLSDSAQAPLTALTVYGHSTQETTTGAQLLKPIDNFPQTKDGVTMSKNNDGSYHLQGTATAEGNFRIIDPDIKKYTLNLIEATISLSAKNGSYDGYCTVASANDSDDWNYIITATTTYIQTWSVVSNKLGCFLTYNNGSAYNVDIYPMLNSGNTALPWEPYTGGKPSPSPEYPQQIVSAGSVMTTGAQLLDESIFKNYAEIPKNVVSYIPLLVGEGIFTLSSDIPKINNVTNIFLLSGSVSSGATTGTNGAYIGHPITVSSREGYITVGYRVKADNNVNNPINFHNMLNSGSTALPWEPYTGGTPGINPYEGEINVMVQAGNLWNGGEFEIHAGGSPTGFAFGPQFLTDFIKQLPNGTYAINYTTDGSGTVGDNYGNITFYNVIGNQALLVNVSTFEMTDEFRNQIGSCALYGYLNQIQTVKNFMLNVGSAALPWEPYKQPWALILSTPGGLPGIPVSFGGNYTDESGQQWVCDEIDLERGKYVQRCYKKNLTRNMSWKYSTTNNGNNNFQLWLNDDEVAYSSNRSICNFLQYTNVSWDDSEINLPKIYANGREITASFPPDNEINSLQAWSNLLDSIGDCYIYYILATPIETDLTAEEMAAYKSLHTYSPTTTVGNDAEAWMKVGYKATS